jgi:uncharacterized protein YbjT (DUF2867 family)/uncharacterized membrane protein YphA (DoxX/SURF4 family)
MKILLTGATGFIGKSLLQALLKHGHQVISSVRDTHDFSKNSIELDFTDMPDEKSLVQKLQGFDIVINAVGIIAPSKNQSFKQMHTQAPISLFKAVKAANVKKIIQISALGTKDGVTPYHTSKAEADTYLRELDIEYAILHPSIVYGDDGKSTALFQALASLPFTPIIEDGSQKLQPIYIDDLSATVLACIDSCEKKIELDLVGEDVVSYKELLQGFRLWLGYKPTKAVSMPTIGTDTLGKILDEPTVNHDNIIMLNDGNSADILPLKNFLGYTPIGIKQNLFEKEAYHAQKLYASLYLIRPLLRWIIGFVWIWSGIVSAFLYPRGDALGLLHDIGIVAPLDVPILYLASLLDISVGILTIVGYKLRFLLSFQILIIVVYTLLLTFMAPFHWLHPFGPVLKNLPLVVTIYILMQLERFR